VDPQQEAPPRRPPRRPQRRGGLGQHRQFSAQIVEVVAAKLVKELDAGGVHLARVVGQQAQVGQQRLDAAQALAAVVEARVGHALAGRVVGRQLGEVGQPDALEGGAQRAIQEVGPLLGAPQPEDDRGALGVLGERGGAAVQQAPHARPRAVMSKVGPQQEDVGSG
jgi:hypothetical protein